MSLTEQTNSVAEERRQVWLLVDRAEGGTSRQAGQMELMLHRRLFNDDAFGVGEALNETAFGFGLVVRGKHSLVPCLESEEECDLRTRILAERSLMKPVILLGSQCTTSNLRYRDSPCQSVSQLENYSGTIPAETSSLPA